MIIDWSRAARPQPDGYDTQVLVELDTARGWTKRPVTSPVTLGHGSIACTLPDISCIDTAFVLDAAWAYNLTSHLTAWAEGYASLIAYMDEFWTWRQQEGRGCSSGHAQMLDKHAIARGSPKHLRHAVYVTSDDVQGCAQGVYHEFGHLRLETFGIHVEHHDGRLLLNPPEELYDSSVRKDKKRPMSAVVHGVYAWLMFGESDYHIYLRNLDQPMLRIYAAHNIPKIHDGCMEIRRYAKWTDEGRTFVSGMLDWAEDLTQRLTVACA